MNKRKTKFILGFPVSIESAENTADQRKKSRQRGVAMLIALLVTALTMLFLAELKIATAVSNRLSLGHHLNTKAEYVAKSGANLGLLLLTSDFALELTIFELGQGTQQAISPPKIWDMLNGFPIGGDTVEMVSAMQEGFDLSSVNDSKVLDQVKDLGGSFVINIEDEASKININFCGRGNGIKCMTMLEALFSCPAEREYLERRKLVATDLVTRIRDYVDENNRPDPKANYSSEEDPYDGKSDNLFPKNAYFDTLDELLNIPGWDRELHKIFSPYLTVYPLPKTTTNQSNLTVNYNGASRELLGCLLPKTNIDCNEQAAIFSNLTEEDERYQEPPNNSQGLKQILQQYHCTSDADKAKQFSYRSDIFRMNVTGIVEGQEKTISTVVQRGLPDDFDKRDEYSSVYKYLHWKML